MVVIIFSLGRVVLYTSFMACPLPKTLVKTLAKNLVKNLTKNLVKHLAKNSSDNLTESCLKIITLPDVSLFSPPSPALDPF